MLGPYRLIRPIGRGGMGEIFLATHVRWSGSFAVKVLNRARVSQQTLMRFLQEASVLGKLRHPNVVRLVDFNTTKDAIAYLVMEYVPGQDLAEILRTRRRQPIGRVHSMLRQMASALHAAHRVGIVHRDLKPKNVMVVSTADHEVRIKVIDFGISKVPHFNFLPETPTILGTPAFMSPEQAEAREADIGYASDEFSLAVIAYLLLTGRLPWKGSTSAEMLHSVSKCNPEPMTMTGAASTSATQAVLLRAMARIPADRYPTVLSFMLALERALILDGLLSLVARRTDVVHARRRVISTADAIGLPKLRVRAVASAAS
jgi:serine/threonine-protein kinase